MGTGPASPAKHSAVMANSRLLSSDCHHSLCTHVSEQASAPSPARPDESNASRAQSEQIPRVNRDTAVCICARHEEARPDTLCPCA